MRIPKSLLAASLAAASIALLLAFTPRSGPVSEGWVHVGGQLDPDGVVSLAYSIIVSPEAPAAEAGAPATRSVSIAINSKVGQIVLQLRHDLRPVPADGTDDLVIQISDLSLNYAPYYAGQLLGVDVPLGPADYSDTYVVKVGPSGEKAWSEVSTAADVSVSAEVRAG